MKKLYKSPQMIVVSIKQTHHLMEASSISQGNAYSSGDAVLSRRRGNSFWDDDDEDYE